VIVNNSSFMNGTRKIRNFYLLILISIVFLSNSCKKTEPEQQIVIGTSVITKISLFSARSGGFIGSGSATEYGVCWSSHSGPTISDSLTSDGSGAGNFISQLNGLEPGHLYYVRSYGTNGKGTIYGNEFSFTTLGKPPVAITKRPAWVENTYVIITGTVKSNLLRTDLYFEFGPDTNYGTKVEASDSYMLGTMDSITVTAGISYLTEFSTYHYRIVAENTLGKVYGNDITFKMSGTKGTVTDIDGNIYQTIVIGNQTWMAENLKTEHFKDGTDIPFVSDALAWLNLFKPGFCWQAGNPANKNRFGGLYNWYAADTKKLCPEGWHVPSRTEWNNIISSGLGASAGGKMKETGFTYWNSPNSGATNSSGFSARGAGLRLAGSDWWQIKEQGCWWSSTISIGDQIQAIHYYINYDDEVLHLSANWRECGMSVRCIEDE
jgi:uncharacterized protein (TIGR02145 family)